MSPRTITNEYGSMKVVKNARLYLGCFLILPLGLSAQENQNKQDTLTNITVQDAAEISYRSELIIGEYRDLLNLISNTDADIRQTRDIIHNSFTGPKNWIFYHSTATLEDDITPTQHESQNAQEKKIDKYLYDFDLLYKKSDTPSVNFTILKVSNVKKRDYFYVKIFFSSRFGNKSAVADADYILNNRVAEVRAYKAGNKWQTQIVRIGFYNASDTLTDDQYNAELLYTPETVQDSASHAQNDSVRISIYTSSLADELKEKERAKLRTEYKKSREAYNKLIEQGEKAFAINDYAAALKAFSDAAELSPDDLYPPIKINQIKKLVKQAQVSAEDLYKEYFEKAKAAEKARKYEVAKEYYRNALEKKPDDASIDEHIRILTAKLRVSIQLAEKYNAGLYKDAIKDYDKAIKQDDQNSDYFLGRGQCYEKIGDDTRALKDYSHAIDLDDNPQALKTRAELYERQGKSVLALTDYAIYVTIDKTDEEIFFRMSSLHESLNNNLKAAMEDIDKAMAINPQNHTAYYKKGLLLIRQKNIVDAIENFSTAIKADSTSPAAYFERGMCEAGLKKSQAAGDDFAKARTLGLDTLSQKSIDGLADEYYRRGQFDLNNGAIDSALPLINTSITFAPSNPTYRFKRGECFYNKKEFTPAISCYTEAIQIYQGYYDALYQRGRSRFNLGDYTHAIEDFQAAQKSNGQIPYTYKALADSYLKIKQYSEAISNYDLALQVLKSTRFPMEPQVLADLYNNKGKSCFESGDLRNAVECFKTAIRLDNSFAEAYFNRGLSFLTLSRLSEAQEDIVKALDYRAKEYAWHFTLGRTYQLENEYYKAANSYTNALNNDSTEQFALLPLYRRGFCYLLAGDYNAALHDYLQYRKAGRDTAIKSFNDELGLIFLKLNNSDSAYNLYSRSLSADSTDGSAQYGIGMLLIQKGQIDPALVWLDKAFSSTQIPYAIVKKEPLLDRIKNDKRFKKLLKKYF
jgi:tetratricopeptide (TPR) repeat protein